MSIKLVKTASGGQSVSMTKEDWLRIGESKGWVTKAQGGEGPDYQARWRCTICGYSGPKETFLQTGEVECPACSQPYVEQITVK